MPDTQEDRQQRLKQIRKQHFGKKDYCPMCRKVFSDKNPCEHVKRKQEQNIAKAKTIASELEDKQEAIEEELDIETLILESVKKLKKRKATSKKIEVSYSYTSIKASGASFSMDLEDIDEAFEKFIAPQVVENVQVAGSLWNIAMRLQYAEHGPTPEYLARHGRG